MTGTQAYDLQFIQETHERGSSSNVENSNIYFQHYDGYTSLRSARVDKKGGGVATIYHTSMFELV